MTAVWHHSRLGKLTRQEGSSTWTTTVRAPAFDAFSYTTNFSSSHPPDGNYSLGFLTGHRDAVPSEAAVALALRVVDEQYAMVRVISDALWNCLNGRGPKTAHWWYGALQRPERSAVLGAPARPMDLLSQLRLKWIYVEDDVRDYPGFLVRLIFRVSHDEHGLDVLMDVDRVVGLGSAGEGELFTDVK